MSGNLSDRDFLFKVFIVLPPKKSLLFSDNRQLVVVPVVIFNKATAINNYNQLAYISL